MRLNKYIASAGICSRRKADELIAAGNVKINGAVMREMGYDVQEGDRVSVNGRPVEAESNKVYVAVNKPKGYITSMDDDRDRATVAQLVSDIPERLFPVGRLDYNTTGLLLMTNDGDLAYRLTHPKHEVYKTYVALVSGIVSDARLARLSIREGKNRQVRKMFKAVGNTVIELERIAIGDVRLGHMQQGHYRKLTRREIDYLKGL